METDPKDVKRLWEYLINNYLEANGMEVTKENFANETECEKTSKLSNKSASKMLGFKEAIEAGLETDKFASVLEIVWSQLISGSEQQTETSHKKKKVKTKKIPKAKDDTHEEDVYDWGGEKLSKPADIVEGDYAFANNSKPHTKTPFEVLKGNNKADPWLVGFKKDTTKQEMDELEQQLDDL